MKSLAETKDTADEISSAAQAIPEAQAESRAMMMEETPAAAQETIISKREGRKTPILQEQIIVDIDLSYKWIKSLDANFGNFGSVGFMKDLKAPHSSSQHRTQRFLFGMKGD